MKKFLFAIACLLLALPARADFTFTVTNTASAIVMPTFPGTPTLYQYVIVRENSASPSAAFTIWNARGATAVPSTGGVILAAGGSYYYTLAGAPLYSPGETIGWIQASTAGPFTFIAVTTNMAPLPPPLPALNNCAGNVGGAWGSLACSGGGGTVTSVGLVGTANQITVTGASPITTSGSWTLSIPSSPTLPGTTTGTFSGNLTGNVTGNVTGSSGSTTGNAATATALAAPPTTCGAGIASTGVDVNGNALGCFTPSGSGVIKAVTTFSGSSVSNVTTTTQTAWQTFSITVPSGATAVLIEFAVHGFFANANGGCALFEVHAGTITGAQIGNTGQLCNTQPSWNIQPTTIVVDASPSAGSHTYVVGYSVSSSPTINLDWMQGWAMVF